MQTIRLKVRRSEIVCALCSGMLTVHGCYSRHCIDEIGERYNGWLAQGHCEACNVYPTLTPSFIAPHKHYKADVIERVITEAEAGDNVESLGVCAADISTMRRWVREFNLRAELAIVYLRSKLPPSRKEYIGSLSLQNTALLHQLDRLIGEYSAQESGGVIGRANIILTTNHCGFL